MLDSNEGSKAVARSEFWIIIPIVTDNTVMFLCMVGQKHSSTKTRINTKIARTILYEFCTQGKCHITSFTMHCGGEVVLFVKSGNLGSWS